MPSNPQSNNPLGNMRENLSLLIEKYGMDDQNFTEKSIEILYRKCLQDMPWMSNTKMISFDQDIMLMNLYVLNSELRVNLVREKFSKNGLSPEQQKILDFHTQIIEENKQAILELLPERQELNLIDEVDSISDDMLGLNKPSVMDKISQLRPKTIIDKVLKKPKKNTH